MTEKTIILYGRSAAKGVAEGEALVTNDAISFLFDIDIIKGTVITPKSTIKGKSVEGKVLVFPMARGSSGGPWGLYMLMKASKLPTAIVNIEADLTAVAGAPALNANTPSSPATRRSILANPAHRISLPPCGVPPCPPDTPFRYG